MADLSHWDFAESFTAHEAAVLILGINDGEAHLEKNALRIGVVTRRMKQAYSLALDFAIYSNFGGDSPHVFNEGDALESIQLNESKSDDEVSFQIWQNTESAFEKQLFSGAELTRWLAAVKQNSKYQFECQAPTEKPLGTRERDTLLTIIAVLCKEAKLDYTKPAKTADLILSTASEMGISIGETTIEEHLKKVPDALRTRVK